MDWWATAPAIAIASLLMIVPGALLAYSMGARRFTAFALAPLGSTALVGVSGILGGLVQIPWNALLLLGVTLVASAVAFIIQLIFRHKISPRDNIQASSKSGVLALVTALVIPGFLITKWLLTSIGNPENFSQAYDNVFHLNAIQFIVQTGNASSLTLGQMVSPDNTIAIYPSAWHSFCALIVQLTGISVFAAENVLTIVVCALVWPLSCVALVRALVGKQLVPVISAGVLAASFWAFPFQLVQRGPLFPNVLSYALLPVVVVIVAGIVGVTRERILNKLALTGLLLIGMAALFTAQPNGFTALLAICLPMLALQWMALFLRTWRSGRQVRKTVWIGLGGLFGLATFIVLWKSLIIPFHEWNPSRSLPQAVGDVVSGGLLGGAPTWLASGLALIGIVSILRRRSGYWMIGAFVSVSILYVAAASVPSGPLRNVLVGSWYEDSPRLAALVPIMMLLLSAQGLVSLHKLTVLGMQAAGGTLKNLNNFGIPSFSQTSVPAISTALVLTTMLAIPAGTGLSLTSTAFITPPLSQSWGKSTDNSWISVNQYTLMKRLDHTVPSDSIIAVNPFNGGSLAFAISGHKVSQYSLSSGPRGDVELLSQAIATRASIHDVCTLSDRSNIRYILDFGPSYLRNYQASLLYPGFVNVGSLPYVTLIDREGDAKLYKISVCSA